MSQKSQSCSLAGFSNRNVSFLYLNADCHLTGPVLSSCWARGHYCSMAVPAAVPGRWPGDSWSLPGWCSPCQYKGEGTTGKKQPVTILAPAASSGPTGPPGAEPPEMLGPDLSSQWGLRKYIPLISTAGPILCQSWKVKKQRLGREGRSERWRESNDCRWWGASMGAEIRATSSQRWSWRGQGITVERWRRKGKERSECLHVSRGEQQWLLMRPFCYYSSISLRIKRKNLSLYTGN